MLKPTDQQPDKASQPIPVTETPTNFEENKGRIGQAVPVPFMDSVNATIQEGFGASHWLGDKAIYSFDAEREKAKQPEGAKIDPDLLNRMFPEVQNPFTQPTTLEVAKDIALRGEMRRNVESIIDRGPKGAVYGLSRFAAGFIPAMFDPVFVGANILTAGASSVAARAFGMGATSFLLTENPTMMQALGRGLVHDIGGFGIAETVNNAYKAKYNEDYSIAESLANVAGGAVIGMGIHAGINYGIPATMKYLRRIGGSAAEVAEKSAAAQFAQGKEVDVSPIVEQAVRDRLVPPKPPENPAAVIPGPPERPAYVFRPITSAEDRASRTFYHGSPKSVGSMGELAHAPIESDLGKGTYLTDSPYVANGMAAGTFAENDGKILLAKLNIKDEAKLLNLEKPLPPQMIDQAMAEMKKSGLEGVVSRADLEAMPGKQAMELLQGLEQQEGSPSAIETMQARAKALGFDGYKMIGGKYLGVDGQPHNMAMLFEHAAGMIEPRSEMKPNRALVPEPQYDKVRQMAQERQGVEHDIGYEADKYPAFKKLIEEPARELDLPKLDEGAKQVMEDLKSLREQGLLTPEHEAFLDSVSEMEKKANDLEKATKAAIACRGKDI